MSRPRATKESNTDSRGQLPDSGQDRAGWKASVS